MRNGLEEAPASPGLEEGVLSALLLHMVDGSIIKGLLECQSRHYVVDGERCKKRRAFRRRESSQVDCMRLFKMLWVLVRRSRGVVRGKSLL